MLGEPDYNYSKLVKEPKELGVSGSSGNVETDIEAITSYMELLVENGDKASKLTEGQTIGDSYFMKSDITCTNESGKEVKRNFYIDNRTSSTAFLPSIIDDITKLPLEMGKMFTIFAEIGPQKCTKKTKTEISQNNDGTQTPSDISRYTHKNEGFSLLEKPLRDKVPHFYILTFGLFFTYVLFNLSLKKK